MEFKDLENTTMYNNCQTHIEELEDVFVASEILYLIEYRNNNPKNYVEIINAMEKLVNGYTRTETVSHNDLKEICLNLWLYCMGNEVYKKGKSLSQLIDLNCNELFDFMTRNYNINILMKLLRICLVEHKKSIDALLEESQGLITFNEIYSKETNNINNENINSFWNTFEILNICMNSILCIAFSQRNSPKIKNNPLFIETFHIDKEPLFVHLFNYIAQDNYCERMPIKKFIIYIRWHIFFTNNSGEKLNNIINNFKTNKSKQKCTIIDFFEIANKIDYNYSPLLILPSSINNKISNESSSFNGSFNGSFNILKKSINELFGKDDEKYDKNSKIIKYERPNNLDYKYPLYKRKIRQFIFEVQNPRIELYGKSIIPKDMTNLFENCYKHLPNRNVKYCNMYACDIYKYMAIKSRIPNWILKQQNKDKILENKKDSSPKWLQNIRMGLGIKMLMKLLCSTMSSSYNINSNIKVLNIPDIRYEIVVPIKKLNFIHLQRHQNILLFNILLLLLGLLKLFKTHEILQFEYLRHLIQKNNGIIVLCKLFGHPWQNINNCKYNNKIFITQPDTYINIQNKQELIDKIYNKEIKNNNNNNNISERIVTIKINTLRIIQKCVKYANGHCHLLCHVLKCNEWFIKYLYNNNDNILKYYILKLYKCMMPFLNKEEYKNIIELIINNIRIGINDQWLSNKIKETFNKMVLKYKVKQELPNNLEISNYYGWLALKKPTERDYAETFHNPYFIKSYYGVPNLLPIAPQKWIELIDNECTTYHEWLIQQIKLENNEFLKQEKYIGLTTKEMEKKQMNERSSKIDKGLANISIPKDFDFEKYLKAYFRGSGNADELLGKM